MIDIDVREIGFLLDFVFRLFDFVGIEVKRSDDDVVLGEIFIYDFYIDFIVFIIGIYYVGVSNYLNFDYNLFVDGGGNFGLFFGSYDIEIIVGSDGIIILGVLGEFNNIIF